VKTAISIGNFDGVHRGHQALCKMLVDFKVQNNEISSTHILTFDPHPVEFFTQQKLPRLSSKDQKISWLKYFGIDRVEVLQFDSALSNMSPKEFFDKVILPLNPGYIALGKGFNFGVDKTGNTKIITEFCNLANIKIEINSGVKCDHQIVSSTAIREFLSAGSIHKVNRFLGRPFSFSGEVIHGDKRGKKIGFPTANILPIDERGLNKICSPKNGVYLTSSTFDGRTFPSITNVGVKPTFKSKSEIVVESHLLRFDEDLYGKNLTVEFHDRLRDECKFSSVEQLVQQIQIDVAHAMEKLT